MFTSSLARRSGVLASFLLAGVMVAGCGAGMAASSNPGSSSSVAGSVGLGGAGMMGGGNDATSQSGWPQMMAAGPGYAYSRLSCSAPSSLPGQKVQVTLADMGMTQMMGGIAPMTARMMLHAGPATVAAGQISFLASNVGWRTHELVILPLTAGTNAGGRTAASDGKVPETGSLGEASGNCASGAGQGIPSGAVGWVTVTLAPGHYELVCNLPNHYADGMYQELTVS